MAPILLRPWNAGLDPELRVEVTLASISDDMLRLRYCVAPPSGIRLPPTTVSRERRDSLWQQTCAELFVGHLGDTSYREFNFSPSGDWAVYDFDAYRHRTNDPQADMPPVIRCQTMPDEIIVDIELPLGLLPAPLVSCELGLSMVLQQEDGSLGYWALAHPGDKPDFHDRRGFILRGSALPGA